MEQGEKACFALSCRARTSAALRVLAASMRGDGRTGVGQFSKQVSKKLRRAEEGAVDEEDEEAVEEEDEEREDAEGDAAEGSGPDDEEQKGGEGDEDGAADGDGDDPLGAFIFFSWASASFLR